MKLTIKSKILIIINLLTVFILAYFATDYYFSKDRLAVLDEVKQEAVGLQLNIRDINNYIKSGILTKDEKYAIAAATASKDAYEAIDRITLVFPEEGGKLEHTYQNFYIRLVSINSLFLENRLEEGVNRIRQLDNSYALIQQEMDQVERLILAEYQQVKNIQSLFMVGVFLGLAIVYIGSMQLMRNIASTISNLQEETRQIAASIESGQLDYRGDVDKVDVEFRGIMVGINNIVDSFVQPMNTTVQYINKISVGEIPPKITTEYQGEFAKVKDSLNNCIDAINALVDDSVQLADAGAEGRLGYRADTVKHRGEFRSVVEGLNETMDALVGHLENIPVPVVLIDKEFNFRYINKSGAKILNKSGRQLLKEKCYDNFKTTDCQNDRCAVARAIAQDTTVSQETTACPNGNRMDIMYTATPFRNRAGEIVGAIEVIIDQTQIMDARRSAQLVADKIEATTNSLTTASKALIEVAALMNVRSEETSDKTTMVSAAIEEITANIDYTATATSETSNNLNYLASAVEQMTASIRNMAAAAEQSSVGVTDVFKVMEHTSENVDNVSRSAKEVSFSVNNVATAVKEINNSLNEVSQNCERSRAIASDAEQQANETTGIIEKLNFSSKQIGKIVKVINDIADQTNMLALNAAIEAAGAGEAGKGFAVVANEVKELAKQTAQATEEISVQIETMQTNMGSAVKAVDMIGNVISETTEITNTIASAVTEQSSTVGEISSSVFDAAEKVNTISRDIEEVAVNMRNIFRSSAEADNGVKEIARSAAEISTASLDMAHNTTQASERMADVARATREISTGANEISQNISEIASSTIETTEDANKTNEAAKKLAEIATNLEDLTKKFQI